MRVVFGEMAATNSTVWHYYLAVSAVNHHPSFAFGETLGKQ